MPISSDRVGGINTSQIAAIGEGNITPAVGDLMKAFREGFLTVDDFTRRGLSLPVEAETQKQNLADQREIRPLARTAQTGALQGEINIQPRKQALQAGQVEAGITALPTPEETQASTAERSRAAHIKNGLASTDANTRLATVAELTTDDVTNTWTVEKGTPPPEQIEVPGRPPAARGTPEYFKALKDELENIAQTKQINAAYVKAIPGVLEKQIGAGAAAQKVQAEGVRNIENDIRQSDTLKNFRLRTQAVQQIKDLTTKPNPTSADDLGIIYSTVRALDPVSAVREGEISLLKKGAGLPQELVIGFNHLFGQPNNVLTPELRKRFLGLAQTQIQSSVTSSLPELQKFQARAISENLPQEQVFNSIEREILSTGRPPASLAGTPSGATPGASQTPQVGDIVVTKDGRKLRVQSITATGFIPDPTYQP